MSLLTSGGISFPIFICCRLLSTLEFHGFFCICTIIAVTLVYCFAVLATVQDMILSTGS